MLHFVQTLGIAVTEHQL